MKVTDIATLPIGKNPHHVDARVAYDTEHAVAVVITLQPGEELKKHITPVDVFFYVLEGTGVVEIGGDEEEEVGRDMLVESPAHIPPPLVQPERCSLSGAGCEGAETYKRDSDALTDLEEQEIGGDFLTGTVNPIVSGQNHPLYFPSASTIMQCTFSALRCVCLL